MSQKKFYTIFFCFWIFLTSLHAETSLRDNLKKAKIGDFIVTTQNKTYTLFHIYDKTEDLLTIEEITIPEEKILSSVSWRDWVKQGAQGNTSWILYTITLSSGQIQDCFSVSRNGWCDLSQWDTFLPKLLNLQLSRIPHQERKKVGPPPTYGPDLRNVWHPTMIVDGKIISGVPFEAWRTHWPKDNSILSGKAIDIYLPEPPSQLPTYFPYFLQVKGISGGTFSIRIIDSGNNLSSPAPPILKRPLSAFA